MTHYLRDSFYRDLVDIETWDGDLNSVIVFRNLFQFVSSLPALKQKEAIDDFEILQEIRGVYFESIKNLKSTSEFVADVMKKISHKYNLCYVVD